MIRVVSFDVGGTLASGELDREVYVDRVVAYLRGIGYSISADDYKRALRPSMERLAKLRAKGREMRFEDFYSAILKRLKIVPSQEILDEIRKLYRLSFPQTVKEGVREVLEELKGRYRLAVISNSMSLLPKYFLEEHGLMHYFEVVVISGAVGYRKPHPRIFRHTLERLGVPAWQVVHVGNSVKEDIAGAKAVGMHAILVRDEAIGLNAGVEADAVVDYITEVPQAVERLNT